MKPPKGRYRIYCLTFSCRSDNIDEIFDLMEKFYRRYDLPREIPPAIVFDTVTQEIKKKPLINLTKKNEK